MAADGEMKIWLDGDLARRRSGEDARMEKNGARVLGGVRFTWQVASHGDVAVLLIVHGVRLDRKPEVVKPGERSLL